MANWKHTLALNDFLKREIFDKYDESKELEQVPQLAEKLASWLSDQPVVRVPRAIIEGIKAARTESRFIQRLSDLFDWCDEARVWCGFPT